MKKSLIILLLILVVLTTGCGKKDVKKDKEPKLAYNEVVLRGISN